MAINLTTIAAGTGGFVIHGQGAGDQSGNSVSSAGDVNGDGFDDLIIGALFGDAAGNAKADAGDSYVVFGKASGWGAAIDLATIAAGTGGFVIHGQDVVDYSGLPVASAGDVNGDGFDDLIIGAPYADAAGNAKGYAGGSYVVFGKASGWGAAIDLATIAAGTGGFVIHGQDAYDWSGYSVASAGDVNGDGFDDLIIGARGGDAAGNAKAGAGDSYVVFGKASGWAAAINLATIAAGTGGFVIHGQDGSDYAGRSVASAGDVNGDGFDDLIIGAWLGDAAGNAKSYAGDSYVVFGKASGWGAAIDLATIAAGSGGFAIHGQDAGDQSGVSVASAGDLNGDGFDDLIIGALGGDAAGNAKDRAGDSYVIFGRDFTGSVTHAGTAAAETLTGSAGADVIVAGQGDDTILGHGGADVLKGGAGNDRIVVSDLAFQRVDGGSGTDTLVLAGTGLTLDLAAIPDTKLRGIEVIELGTNTLRVTALEVLNLSDSSNTLRVTGSIGFTLIFDDAGWVTGATVGGFTTHTNGQATLLEKNTTPTAGADTLDGTGAGDTIDALAGHDSVLGLAGDDRLLGGTGNDTLDGGSGNDTLLGGTGDDSLDGGTGADSMVGGPGNDAYVVDDAADRILETRPGGADTVYSSITWTLGPHLEDLVLTGDAAINGTGNNLANVIIGNDAANVLNGGGRADTLIGGGGNDLYLVDATDVLIEQSGGGHDTVVANATFRLPDHIEDLLFNGTANVRGDGNAGDNLIRGNAGNNRLLGHDGNDTLNGGLGDDILFGGNGADSLVGSDGADTMVGGAGDDLYLVDALDRVIEAANEGIDTILTAVSYTLPVNVENLTLLGSGDLTGTGNAQDNVLIGNGGANLLRGLGGADSIAGGQGADTLEGGGGLDLFLWLSPAEGGDVVTDFRPGEDRLAFLSSGFGGLAVVTLSQNAASGAAAQFVYTKASGALEWDADGTGAGAAVIIATLSNKPTLAATDFVIL